MVLLYSLMLSVVLSSQQPAVQSQQNVVDELKSIRATLESVDKSQRMIVALVRIQIDEGRLAPLERQRQALAAQELALTQEMDKLAPVLQREAAGGTAVVTAAGSDPSLARVDPSPSRVRHDEAIRKLDETRSAIRALDESIGPLRAQIAAWEKLFRELNGRL